MGKYRRSKFRPKELAIILSHYELGAINEIHSFRRGNVRSPKAVIITETGKYLLKRREPRDEDPYRVALSHDMQFHLAKKGFCLAALMGTCHSNSSMLQFQSSIYELFEFVEGSGYDGTESCAVSAGKCLRRFHKLISDYDPAYQVSSHSYHDSGSVRKHIQELVGVLSQDEEAQASQDQVTSLSERLLADYNEAAERAEGAGFGKLETIICHGDWHPGNMIFREGQVAAVFDFDSVHYMPALGDVANGCLQFSLLARGSNPDNWPDHLDGRRARSFLAGYKGTENWSSEYFELIAALMIEALIAEAVRPIAATGRFAEVQGFRFLGMVRRKVAWLEREAIGALC